MGIIASAISILTIGCFLTINTYAEKAEPKKKEVPTYAIFSDYTLDVDNPDEVVEDADYVFVGKVTEETGTIYKNKTPIEQEDGSIEYIGEAYTNYKVEVISNLKNELTLNKEIALEKQGGIVKMVLLMMFLKMTSYQKKAKSIFSLLIRKTMDHSL